jgi:DNA polymerase II small subunit
VVEGSVAGALREHLVAYFEEHHKLLEAGALQLLLSDRQPLALSRELVARAGEESPFVTREMVEAVLARRQSPEARSEPLTAGLVASATARRPTVPFELVCEGFTGPPVASQPIAAYEALFQSRFRAIARMLRGRPELPNLRPIRELRSTEGLSSIIGMVREVRETPQRHHIILTVDDETGSVETLVPKDSPGSRVTFLSDEVVGLALSFSKEPGRIPRVTHVERPDVPSTRPMGRASSPRRAMFLSDLHIGSKSFLSENWAHLVEFLRGRGPFPDLAASIDHVVIAGDLVDGIGIYPRQERDLAILDVVEQYAELGRRLSELPDRLTVVAIPGNHDAVSPAEPQPALPLNLGSLLPSNVRNLANPSTFALAGVVVEAYHGRSFDDLIPAIPGASYARPTEVMKRMLQMRHLAPIYGDRTPLAPLPRDGLVIDPPPDILVTGHAHTYGVDRYRGVLLLNASTWQSETEYQRMRNISPVPARAAVVDLATLGLATLDFSAGRPTVGESPA